MVPSYKPLLPHCLLSAPDPALTWDPYSYAPVKKQRAPLFALSSPSPLPGASRMNQLRLQFKKVAGLGWGRA